MRRVFLKTLFILIGSILILMSVFGLLYKFVVPEIISNTKMAFVAEKQLSKAINSEIKIKNMKLKTGKEIAFTVDDFEIIKDKKRLLYLKNIDILISFEDILHKRIIAKKLLAEEIFVDAYKIQEIIPKTEKKKKEKKSNIEFDLKNVLLGVKKSQIIYNDGDLDVDFRASHMIFDRTKSRKYLHFDFNFDMKKAGKIVSVSANDKNRFYMENKMAYIVDFPIKIEKSMIVINAKTDNKFNYELNILANDFNAYDIYDIVSSNIIVANGKEILLPVGNVKGNVDFNLKLTNTARKGTIDVKSVKFEVIPLLNMPVKVQKGHVDIGNNDITFKDFSGYYNNNNINTFELKGDIKDYTKTCDTKILSKVFITNDFFKNYLSKMLNSPIELVGDADSFLKMTSKNGSFNLVWYFLLKEGEGFKLGEQSMVLKKYKTMFKVDLSVIRNILKINTLNYYITNELKRGMTPVLKMDGNIDMADNMKFLDLNLDIPRPLPSEFLNFLLGQKIFKKGEISGNMNVNNHGSVPILNGIFAFDKVILPAQGLYIRSAKMIAKDNDIKLNSEGRFRRANYNFNGIVNNEIKLPVVVKYVNLNIDNIDVERILNPPPPKDAEYQLADNSTNDDIVDEVPEFKKGILIIEKCTFNLVNGIYKDIKFGNLKADMTLDKDCLLNLKSNRFDIADGISTLRIKANLADRNYYIKLGVKDVDSNVMASSILGLPRQISGKAMGLIELNTDKTLKLNGDIKFKIKNGTIEQVGYVEYILKVASLFRNPLAMISPSTVVDLVNIPEGKFDEIQGEMKLKDNIVDRMKIESTAPELAALIFGRYDLTNNDASLRIYTKFSDKGKGFAGALRNISLNSLATKISISSRNVSNYYSNELAQIPKLQNGEERAQVFLTKVDGDVINLNFLSSLKRIK